MKSISLVKESKSNMMTIPMGCDHDGCPTVYLEGGKELLDLPEEGTITFKFDRKSLTVKEDGVEIRLKLLSIEDAKEEAVEDTEEDENGELDGATAIDKLKAEMEDEGEE